MKKIHIFVLVSLVHLVAFSVNMPQKATAATSSNQLKNRAYAMSSNQTQTPGEYIDDSLATTLVKTNILEEKGLSSLRISVTTKDGVVTLSGTIDTAENVELAGKVAKMTNGVKRVVNNLQVGNETLQSADDYIDDAAITAAVKANILEEKGLSSLKISVTTLNGVVALSGTTNTTEHAQQAEAVARQAKGVRQVVNNLQIAN